MEAPLFADKSHPPTDVDLAAVLGRAKRHWDRFVDHVRAASPAATAEWKYYTAKYGWTFVVREKRRNLLYLKPLKKRFMASFAFGDQAVLAAEQSDLPDEIVKPIRQSPKLPEGHAVRIDVTSAPTVAIAQKLLAIKLAN